MEKREVARLLGELKGASASIVLALVCLGKPLTRKDLITVTRYSGPTVDKALDRLSLLGFVEQEGQTRQHYLTVQARQFILGEMQATLPAGEEPALEVKKFFTSSCHVHGCKVSTNRHESDTSHVHETSENILLDEYAQKAVDMLIDMGRFERTPNGKGALDSVEAALEAGWTGKQCLQCVEGFLTYWEQEGDIFRPGSQDGYIAYALREQRQAPKVKPKEDPSAKYITGEYADIIQY